MERTTDIEITEETTRRHGSSKEHRASRPPSRAPSRAPQASGGRPSTRPNGDAGKLDAADNFKRLVICCDGTWLDSDSGLKMGKIVPPSNVTRITRAIKPESENGIQQIVYYQAGVGSMGTIGNKIIGGISGDGLAEHVREAYSFLANNYDDGDELFLCGFSRGAYTARAVAGLVDGIGVLTKKGLESFPVIYKDFAHRHDRSYRTPQPNIPFPNKPNAKRPEYARELARRRLTSLGVKIKAIGVFDTVGSLGVPQIGPSGFLGKFGNQAIAKDLGEYRFYDTALGNCIENAFQALALDEKRAAFGPTLWEKRSDNGTNLIQVWFPGVHANIGGGYDDQELSNITLAWMMAMFSPLLDLNLDYIIGQEKENGDYYDDKGERPRPWSFGKIVNSATGLFALGGTVMRTPGDYMRMDYRTGDATSRPLKNTNEYIHPSVRVRYNLGGPGYADKGTYDPKALKPWRLRHDPNVKGMPTSWFWEDSEGVILPEPPLRQVEKMLLEPSVDCKREVLGEGRREERRDDRRDENKRDSKRQSRVEEGWDNRRGNGRDDRGDRRRDDAGGDRRDEGRDDRRQSKRMSFQPAQPLGDLWGD